VRGKLARDEGCYSGRWGSDQTASPYVQHPKIMIPVLNRPFFEHLTDYLKKHNITDIILAVGKLSEQIEHYSGDGSKFGVSLAYSTEDFPMGTAGAVKNAERFLDDSFIVFTEIFSPILT